MRCEILPVGCLKDYQYVVIFSRYEGRYLFSRHRERETWETQGGHVEAKETPTEAAKRELYEESGAVEFTLQPLCDYQVSRGDDQSNGMVFAAEITKLERLPSSEMEEVGLFEALPENLTYPEITPILFAHLEETL